MNKQQWSLIFTVKAKRDQKVRGEAPRSEQWAFFSHWQYSAEGHRGLCVCLTWEQRRESEEHMNHSTREIKVQQPVMEDMSVHEKPPSKGFYSHQLNNISESLYSLWCFFNNVQHQFSSRVKNTTPSLTSQNKKTVCMLSLIRTTSTEYTCLSIMDQINHTLCQWFRCVSCWSLETTPLPETSSPSFLLPSYQ